MVTSALVSRFNTLRGEVKSVFSNFERAGSFNYDKAIKVCRALFDAEEAGHLKNAEVMNPFVKELPQKGGREITCFTKCEENSYHVLKAVCKDGVCNGKQHLISEVAYAKMIKELSSSFQMPEVMQAGLGMGIAIAAAVTFVSALILFGAACTPEGSRSKIIDVWIEDAPHDGEMPSEEVDENEPVEVKEAGEGDQAAELQAEAEVGVDQVTGDGEIGQDTYEVKEDICYDIEAQDGPSDGALEDAEDTHYIEDIKLIEIEDQEPIVNVPVVMEFANPVNEPQKPTESKAACHFDSKPDKWLINSVKQGDVEYTDQIPAKVFKSQPAPGVATKVKMTNGEGDVFECDINHTQQPYDPIVRWEFACGDFLGLYNAMTMLVIDTGLIGMGDQGLYIELKGVWQGNGNEIECSSTFSTVYSTGGGQ